MDLNLNTRQLNDLELLMNGSFAPLITYMNKDDYESCLYNMRLTNGQLWPMPIILSLSNTLCDKLKLNFDENMYQLLFKVYSNQFPVNVKVSFYNYNENIDSFDSHINNDSLFSYLLSELILANKTRHILLPIINFDVKLADIEKLIKEDNCYNIIIYLQLVRSKLQRAGTRTSRYLIGFGVLSTSRYVYCSIPFNFI